MVDTLVPEPRDRTPGWTEAFAALPLESPPRDGWRQLERKLAVGARREQASRRERRASWTIGLASAAVLAVVAWSPLLRWAQPAQDGGMRKGATIAGQPVRPAALPRTEAIPPVVEARTAAANDSAGPAGPKPGDMQQPRDMPARVAAVEPSSGEQRGSSPSNAGPSGISGTATPAPQLARAQATSSGDTPPHGATNGSSTDADAIRQLQAQSAQLEALVALARDDSAGSAIAAVAGGELDASIAAIDSALTEPELSDEQRTALWQQRIDALQELARLESTERWLASQGALYDTALVSVD